jgi:translation initiation factor 2B subunit (eIF-2B alpha/beta/delta family)
MEESEVIVFGADGIYSDGFIVNKIGSRSLVACGSMLKVPIYVISESYKASKVCPCNLKVIDYEIFGHSTRIPLFEKLELEKINFLVTNVGIYPNPKSADIINIHNHFIQSVIKNII